MGNIGMKPLFAAALAVAALAATLPGPALAAGKVPTKVGQCVQTRIARITSRLVDAPDSGTHVDYANGIYGVDYEPVAPVLRSKVGDKIELCLASLPQDCPPGDERGKMYAAFNVRTQEYWQLPDAEHMCGGA
jgi:hypothetical protein